LEKYMEKFLVHFLAPAATMAEWMAKPEEERKVAEKQMMDEWNAWTEAHKDMIKETHSAGKTKRVSASGVEDTKNDLMLYSIVEAESHEAAAKAFEGHPHFGIPGATIEVMTTRAM
jgi:hypothetical protein